MDETEVLSIFCIIQLVMNFIHEICHFWLDSTLKNLFYCMYLFTIYY